MPRSSYSSSSSSLPPLFLLLLLLSARRGGAAEDAAACGDAFRAGEDDFVLDAEEASRAGAALLATARVSSGAECELRCCGDARCNLALMEPRAAAAEETRMCVLFDCVYRNRFVCRFVNQQGYRSYIRRSVYRRHLRGPGKQAPPIVIADRDVIVQPGEMVTLNGIESLALGDAQITDYSWSLQSGDASIKMESTELPDQLRLPSLKPGLFVFKLTVTDSNGQSDDAMVSVLVLSPELTSSYCLAPPKVGPCRAAFTRWRYDATAGKCEQFTFGGCKPNNNNFLSEKECESACRGVTALAERSVVLPAAECGSPCRPDQLTCSNGCCLDRSLECDGVQHCVNASDEDHCSKLNQTFSRLLSIDVDKRKARCTEPPRTGPCRASHTRWYYDPLDRKCNRFTYGGCDGNDNNFEEDQKCSETCKGVTEKNVFSRGMFDRLETEDEDASDDSGSIAVAVVLSVAILALLAFLSYCFLRGRRERSRSSATTSPAHVPLSEQETLVYNSTTKPV
ncbi:kunitz-type protease inhibitor 1b [Odontesthes bonariensis]|uniref:kunitz-type protease inhibitor 1b n=1 Tax=Odontesthes bonariensis TaxID=219752 RepID=UPI003F58E047